MNQRDENIIKLLVFFYNYDGESIDKIRNNLTNMTEQQKDELLQTLFDEYKIYNSNLSRLTTKLVELNNDFETLKEQQSADDLLSNI